MKLVRVFRIMVEKKFEFYVKEVFAIKQSGLLWWGALANHSCHGKPQPDCKGAPRLCKRHERVYKKGTRECREGARGCKGGQVNGGGAQDGLKIVNLVLSVLICLGGLKLDGACLVALGYHWFRSEIPYG